MTSDGTLKITGFGLVKVGLPDEAGAEERVPMPTGQCILGPSLAKVPFCFPFCSHRPAMSAKQSDPALSVHR